MSREIKSLNVEVNHVELTDDDMHAWVLATEVLFRIKARLGSDNKMESTDHGYPALTHEVAA